MALQSVPFSLQAEDADILSSTNATQVRDPDSPEIVEPGKILDADDLRPGSTGPGYVDYGAGGGTEGDTVSFAFELDAARNATLHFRYANGGNTDRPLELTVNGSPAGTLTFSPTSGWGSWDVAATDVALAAGSNVVSLSIGAASLTGPNLDAFAVTDPGGTPVFGTGEAPTDISLDADPVTENVTGVAVGTLSALDPDGDDAALSFAVDDPRFVVNGTALELATDTFLDFEASPSMPLQITATDASGLNATQTVTVTVVDVDEAPEFTGDGTIGDVTLVEGNPLSLDLDAALGAVDPEGAAVIYEVGQAGSGTLPPGLTVANGILSADDTLALGTYDLVVTASDGALVSDPVAFSVTVLEEGTAPPPIVVQAENGSINLATGAGTITLVRDADMPEPGLNGGLRPGFSGTGYVDFGDDAGDALVFSIDVPQAGEYDLGVRYASQDFGGAPRSLDIVVNGNGGTTLFPSTGPSSGPSANQGFNNWDVLTQTVSLAAGTNVIELAIPAGATSGPNIDRIEIVAAGTPGADTSADEDGNLALSGPGVVSQSDLGAISFGISGLDADIVLVELSLDGGVTRSTVTPDASGLFTFDGTALATGTYSATLFVTDDAGNVAEASVPLSVEEVPQAGGVFQAEDFRITDADGDTVARVPGSPEGGANASNSGPGLPFDANGLRPGYEGDGYLDMGNDVGDAAGFVVAAPEAGTYQVDIRYALGAGARPMDLLVNGNAQTLGFASSGGWGNWAELSVDVDLSAGSNALQLVNTIANGPNIDAVTITREVPPEERAEIRYEPVARINFEPEPGAVPSGYATPAGFLADTGQAFGARGGGVNYGWVSEASIADGTANGTVATPLPAGAVTYDDQVPTASDAQRTSAVFDAAGGARGWEYALENGTYLVKVSLGATSGSAGDAYALNIEGAAATPDFSPSGLGLPGAGAGFRSALVTSVAEVEDGRLTLDAIGGTSTDIQWVEIERIADLTPGDSAPAGNDYSYFSAPVADSLEDGQVSISIGAGGSLPTDIDPTSTFVVGVVLRGQDYRGPNIVHTGDVALVETVTGVEVPIKVQISGGADSLNVRPIEDLDPFTSYTLRVENVLDLGSLSDETAPLRQMQDLTTTFVTGAEPEPVSSDVTFGTQTLLDGFGDGAAGFTSVELSADGRLYVATITGEILRWSIEADGTLDLASREVFSDPYFAAGDGERRGIVGLAFDPDDPRTIWITDNAPIPRESKSFSSPEFSGRVSKITLDATLSFDGATIETYITGLPRSGGDHVTNSLRFRDNPAAGELGEPDHLLYVSQGSNSAAGLADPAWGLRPERLLSGAVLEIDPSRDAPAGGFDVRTEPVSSIVDPTTRPPLSEFEPDGTYPGLYDPFADDAVLKIYATGIRNAYDLAWHSNGNLYVPTNGTAAGGWTPSDPTQPGFNTAVQNAPKQSDFLFTVDEGGYYGHPNTLRGEYILNGGNPTAGVDPFEVVDAADGNPTTNGYEVGVQPDPDYDQNGVYSLNANRSPNGVVEYGHGAFGPDFEDALLIAQFSVGDTVRLLDLDASGGVAEDTVLRRANGTVIDNYIDPLDLVSDEFTGNVYMVTLDRSTGASQLVLMTPTPNGTGGDFTADEGGDLALSAFDLTDPSAAVFQVAGLDDDIRRATLSINGQPEVEVDLNNQDRFTIDLNGLGGPLVSATLRIVDDNLNEAQTTFQPSGSVDPVFAELVTIQSELRTPIDGTSVAIATGGGAGIEIRDASNPDPAGNPAQVDGLYPGAFGIDGNTDNGDGTPGGYADFGSSNADFVTYAFDAPVASEAELLIRYANGGGGDRPLQVEVNGEVLSTISFPATGSFTTWQSVEVSADLVAGSNSVTLRSVQNTGPNIDQIEVRTPTFFPIPVAIDETARIEAEAIDGSAYAPDPSTLNFFFTVEQSGLYRIDSVANADAALGSAITWSLGDVTRTTPFPGDTPAEGEEIFVSLDAGTSYSLELASVAGLDTALDYIDVERVAGDADADIAVQSLDPAFFDDRLHFNYLEDPVQNGFTRDYKENGTISVTNEGSAPLEVLDWQLDGPFSLALPGQLDGLVLAPGAAVEVEVNFERSLYTPPTDNVNGTSTVFDGGLEIVTNDAEDPTVTVNLSGFWQQTWENGQEPNVNELWEVFGFSNRIEGLGLLDGGGGTALDTNDVYMKNDPTEILSPYWRIADGVTEARATQLAAFHGVNQATLGIHEPGGDKFGGVTFWSHSSADNQRILPNILGQGDAFATRGFIAGDIPDTWLGDDVFGIVMDGGSTDPRLNPSGGVTVPDAQQGHTVKMFQAYDDEGALLENVYLGIMDYTGINYDFNDNVFLFEGIAPVGVGPTAPLADSYPDPAGTPVSDFETDMML